MFPLLVFFLLLLLFVLLIAIAPRAACHRLAFVSRLLEFEGIYYFYEHADGAHKIVLVDDRNAHQALDPATVRVAPPGAMRDQAHLWSVTERRALGPAKVTVADYDFIAPATNLLRSKAAATVVGSPTTRNGQPQPGSAGEWGATAEVYDYPAKFGSRTTASGDRYSAVWLDAHRRRMARSFAQGQLFAAAVGRHVTLDFGGATAEYLIVGTTHNYAGPAYHSGEHEDEDFAVSLELMPADAQYRPALTTPRPRVLGPQTALVVGPAGEEIHTDEYGRIKVQFFWDREGRKDENSSCFIRVVQSGAGQGWGSFALPRIGQEVVVEFLDGDPDRPIVTGAVYNASNTVPEALPANKTQFGMKSRITKGGGGHNRLWFEDKKASEVVWFRAERDYKANIVNKDEERQYDKGDRRVTFLKGSDALTIAEGHRTATIQQDDTLEVKQGSVSVKVDMGKHTTDAMQSIELICGTSKIRLDPTSITIDAMTIKINGQMMVETKGLMVQTEASAIQTIKGGMVMIN
jgi:type VI secretion system secreted protein VgrG